MSKVFKKIVLSILAFLILFVAVAPNFLVAYADTSSTTTTTTTEPWYNQDFFGWYAKVNDQSNPSEIFGERYTSAQVQWVVYGLLSIPLNAITGMIPGFTSCVSAVSTQSPTDEAACGLAVATFMTNTISTFGLGPLFPETTDPHANLAKEVFNTQDRQLSGIVYVKNLVGRLSPVTTVMPKVLAIPFLIRYKNTGQDLEIWLTQLLYL